MNISVGGNILNGFVLQKIGWHILIIVIFLSICLAGISSYFELNHLITSPKHGFLDSSTFDLISDQIKNQKEEGFFSHQELNILWFVIYTIRTLCILVILFLVSFYLEKCKNIGYKIIVAAIITGILFLTLIESFVYLGVLELSKDNISLNRLGNINSKNLLSYKNLLWGIGIFIAGRNILQLFFRNELLILNKKINKDHITAAIKNVLWSSWFSLIIIIIVLVLIGFAGQGGAIIIDLLSCWLNIPVLFFLLNLLALLVCHYPSYLIEINDAESRDTLWVMDAKKYFMGSNLGLGNISYIPNRKKDPQQDLYENILKRSLGIILYLTWIYGLCILADKFNDSSYFVSYVFSLSSLLLVGIFLLIELAKYEEKKKSKNNFFLKIYTSLTSFYFFTLITTAVSYVVTTVYIGDGSFSNNKLLLLIIASIFSTLLFITFSESRSSFIKNFEPDEIYDYLPKNRITDRKKNRFYRFMANLSHNAYYVQFIKYWGVSSFFLYMSFIGYATFDDKLNTYEQLNPVLILFFFLIFFYSGLVILLKHMEYYKQSGVKIRFEDNVDSASAYQINAISKNLKEYQLFNSNKKLFGWIRSFLLPLVVVMAIAGFLTGNKLHELHSVSHVNSEDMDIDHYCNQVKKIDDTSPLYTISSYGGGLMADSWTMLILNELQKNKRILDRTISMSGVSGGGLGITNYTSIYKSTDNKDEIKNAIDAVGKSNVLSLEINHWFTSDLFREFLPYATPYSKHDRSYYAMRSLAEKSRFPKESKIEDIGFRAFWKDLYETKGHYPVLLINSSSTSSKYGVASSVILQEDLPGSVDILNLSDSTTLSFYEASSTTNRFPFLSPAAQIPRKGYFIDGGYFDNSGLQSTLSFLDALEIEAKAKDKVKHIVIGTSKNGYIKSFLKELKDSFSIDIKLDKEKQSIELASIAAAALIDVDKLPITLEESLELEGRLIKVNQPHFLHYDDICTYLKGTPTRPLDVVARIEIHNDSLKKHLNQKSKTDNYNYDQWGIIEPSLARLLGEPAVEFQKRMLIFPPLVETLNRIQ